MFTGKVALVTGGSRGIGLAVARALVERGAQVAITATSDTTLRAGAAVLKDVGGAKAVLPVRADARRFEEVERAVGTVVEQFGGLDILVNNAGIGLFRPVAEMTVEQWHSVIDTNVNGVFYACHAALPHLRSRGGGWIISISSLASVNAFPAAAAYSASKAAVNAFSEALMQEVRGEGIRVSYIMPGSVRTEFTGAPGQHDEWKLAPEDVAQVVVDLVAHPSRSLPSRVEIRPSQPPRKN